MSNRLTCPICSNLKYSTYLSSNGFQLLICQKCGLIRTKLLDKTLGRGQELYDDPDEAAKHFNDQGVDFQRYASNFLDFLDVKEGKLLDVGCGFGWVVAEAQKRGFGGLGIDLSKEYTGLGKRKLKVKLLSVSLEEYTTTKKFDVITLNHVLEHIAEPNKFLKKINSLLNPGGKILVATPNIKSFMYFIFKNRWYGLQPAQHVWQFSPNSLTRLLLNNGYEVEQVSMPNLDYQVTGWKKLIFKAILGLAPKLNLGDQAFVLGRKI